MKFPLCLFILFIFAINQLHASEEKILTAFETLQIAQKQLGERSGKHLLRIETENAKLKPRFWWIRFYDDSLFFKARVVQMIGPEMMKNVEPANPFDGGNVEYVISPDQLKYDSDKVINFIERAAKENKIPLHSINLRLEKPHPGESNPIWYSEWFSENRKSLGKLNVSATTGKVTEVIGLKIKDPRFAGVSKKSFPENVEDTFLGIGADLEEFFTGKRTVDQKE